MGAQFQKSTQPIEAQYEHVLSEPNPFSQDECGKIIKEWQYCVDTPITHGECFSGGGCGYTNNCKLNVRPLQFCGGLKMLNLRKQFDSDLQWEQKAHPAQLQEWTDAVADNPHVDRAKIMNAVYRQRLCAQMDMHSGLSKRGEPLFDIRQLVYRQNCTEK